MCARPAGTTSRLLHAGLAAAGILLCAVVAALLPPLWEGVSGRDFRPQATLMAFLVLAFALVLRRLGWDLADFVLGLAATEVVTLSVIAYFSGFTGAEILDPFNLLWLAFMNLFIGGPWAVGYGLGSVWLGRRRARAAKTVAE